MSKSRVLTRRPIWIAWYPLRGRRCMFGFDETRDQNGWHFSAALGPLYMGLGPGVPLP